MSKDASWLLDLYHANGTIRAATNDLQTDQDYDTLGAAYPKLIKDTDLEVVTSLTDILYGVQVASTVTVTLDNATTATALPSAIDGLLVWLRAESLSDHADGAAVASWPDSSGNGYHAVQAVGTRQPVYKTSVQNGRSVVRFDGVNDTLKIPSLPLPTFVTVICAARFTTAKPLLIEHSAYASAYDGFYVYGSEYYSLLVRRTDTHSVPGTAQWMGSGWAIVAARYDGTHLVTLNGAAQVNGTPVGSALANSFVTADLYIGSRADASLYGDGDLQELQIYNRALRTDEIQGLVWGLARKLAVTTDPPAPGLDADWEWRKTPCVLKRYDRIAHELVTEFSGVVADANFNGDTAALTLASHDQSVLATPVPRQVVNVDEFPSATDLGAPIPVVMGGPVYLTPPYCGYDDEGGDPTDPGGKDLVVGTLQDAAGASMDLRVEDVFYDQGSAAAGLMLASSWDAGPGTPTFVNAVQFSVTGDQAARYDDSGVGGGMPFRTVTTDSLGQWVYGWVTTYAAGTVTVAGCILDAGMTAGGFVAAIYSAPTAGGTGYVVGDILVINAGNSNARVRVLAVSGGTVTRLALVSPGNGYSTGAGIATTGGSGAGDCTVNVQTVTGAQVAFEYLIESGRYTSGTKALLSLRMLTGLDGAVVVRANNQSLANPATAIAEIMQNATWGLGETIAAISFGVAAAAFTTAGLGTALAGGLGLDKQQKSAGQAISELLMLRGGRLTYDAALVPPAWTIGVDAAPTAPVITLDYGMGANNVKTVNWRRRTPLDSAVQILTLRYGGKGRVKSTADGVMSQATDYAYTLNASVLSRGTRKILTSDWINTHDAARKVLSYLSKRMKYADDVIELVAGPEGRAPRVGDLVHFRSAPHNIDATYRVRQTARKLWETRMQLEGYDPSIYTVANSDVWYDNGVGIGTQNDGAGIDQRQATSGEGENLIHNADFSIPPRLANPTSDAILPGWNFYPYTNLTSVITTKNAGAVGGYYVTIVTNAGMPGGNTAFAAADLASTSLVTSSVVQGHLYGFSIWADTPAGAAWDVNIIWRSAAGANIGKTVPIMRVDPLMPNGLGWRRYYCVARAAPTVPTNTVAYAEVQIYLLNAATYKFDAAQFEEVTRLTRKPTPWKRSGTHAGDPASFLPGPQTVRALGEAELGTVAGVKTWVMTGFPNGGNFKNSAISATEGIETGMVVDSITALITTTIGTSTSITINLGVPGNDILFASAKSPAAATGINAAVDGDGATYAAGKAYAAAAPIRLTANSGTFNGTGAVTIAIHYRKFVAPTG